jgi:hypothetical protein
MTIHHGSLQSVIGLARADGKSLRLNLKMAIFGLTEGLRLHHREAAAASHNRGGALL